MYGEAMIKELTRDYNMTKSELCMFTSNLIGIMNRDSVEMLLKDVTALDITALQDMGDAYELFPDDAYYQGDVTISVEIKNALKESCIIQMRAIIGCAKIKWGASSAQVKRFNASKMSVERDRNLLTMARQCVTLASSYLLDLTDVGLTQAMIDSLSADAQSMEDEMNNISEKELIRDMKTEERLTDGNELYGYVSKYCEIGKIIWQDVSEAKYNDYVIYASQSSLLPKPQNFTAVVDAGDPTNVNIDFDMVDGALEYLLYYAESEIGHPSGTFDYIGTATTNHFDAPLIAGKRNYWKVRAKNETQTSNYSNEAFIDA